MEKYYKFIFNKFFLLLFVSFNYLSAQNMGSNDDFDGDGIINSVDIDDDNDGILDAIEAPTNAINTVTNPTFDTNTTGWNLASPWARYANALAGRQNTVSAIASASQSNVALKNNCTTYAIYQLKIRTDNYIASSGAIVTESMSLGAYLGGVRLFGVSNPATSASPTITRDPAANGIITEFRVDGVLINASAPKSISLLAYHNIQISFNPAALPATGNIEFRYTSTGDDVLIDDVYYYINSCLDTDNDGIPNQFDLDSDGDGCPDALEAGPLAYATINGGTYSSGTLVNSGGSTTIHPFAIVGNKTIPANYGANGFYNNIESNDTSTAAYTSSYTYDNAINNSKTDTCKDTDGDGIPDVLDIDDDNDGIPDTAEQQELSCSPTVCNSWVSPPTAAGTTAPATIIVDGESITYTITTNQAITPQYGSWLDFQCGLGTITGLPYWQRVDANNQTVTFNFSKPVTNLQFVLSAIESAPPFLTESVQITTNNSTGQQRICPSCNRSSIVATNANTINVLGTGSNAEIFKIDGPAYTTATIKVTSVGGAFLLAYGVCGLSTTESQRYVDIDTDGDNIPNRLDLDSDGDDCSDLSEAGVNPTTDAITPSTTNNTGGSYGIDPTKSAGSQLNPSGVDTNNDGLNDSVDSDVNGSPNYSSSYSPAALSKAIKSCTDLDRDGIKDLADIDDDNDGVLDTTESPKCFYTLSELKNQAYITSDLSYDTPFSRAIDGDNTTWADINSGFVTNRNLAEFNLPLAKPLPISTVTVQIGINNAFPNSSFQLQGWTGNSWEALSAAQPMVTSNTTYTFTNTLMPSKAYNRFRIRGLTGTITNGTRLHEINFNFGTSYDVSAQPKPICTTDTDGDSIFNHQDLDSDGDGCPDAVEAGVVNNVGAANTSTGTVVNTPANGGTQTNVSQAIIGNGLPASYGNNGFYTGIESNDTFAATYTGTYIYNQYAIVSTINACIDTDGDGVIDVIDIDDDNDGVLDIIESPACAMTLRDDDANRLVWDFEGNLHTLPTTDYNAAQTQPYTSRTFGSGVVDVSGANVLRFTGATETNFDDAVANGDYMQYYFTTSTKYLSIDKVVNGSIAPAALKQGAIISTDPTFATYTVLDRGEVPFTDVTPILNNDLTTYDNYSLNINTKYYVRFVYYGLTGTTQTAIDAVGLSFDEISNPQYCINGLDLDNDGIPNQLDLDSDGDGCPDTKEAILYNHSTEASIAGNVKNGNGGTVTSTVSTPNAMVPAPYGSNGFADALQSASNPDAYKYVYSYQFVATDANVSTCDNKFLSDIDSDDDGTPDAVESPSCFYTEAQAMDITEGVTSDFAWTTANPLSNTYDDNTTTFGATSSTVVNIQNKALITFDIPVIDAALIDQVKLNVGVSFGAGTWRLEGLDMLSNTWVSLSSPTGQAMSSATTFIFTNTEHQTTKYHTYRIIGVNSTNITNNAQLKEFSIIYKNYNPSLHRTKMGCNSDIDGDGVPNYLDRDSDGDGCPDAVEAGINLSLLLPSNFYNTGGNVPGTHVIVGGTYGDNGLSNDVETPADSGILNYPSTYNMYATDININICRDTDNDGVPDVLDLDDDNDGILDAVESPTCFYTAAEAIIPVKISTGLASSTVNSVAITPGNDIPTMHDTTTSNTPASNHVVPANQLGTTSVVIYKVEYPTRLGLTQMTVTGNAVSWGAGSAAVLEGSNNDITYEAVSDPLATSSTSGTKTWLVNNSLPTAANLYKYYRIRVSTVGSTQLTFTNYEVSGTLKTATYSPSAHTKHGCVNDTDGDGISNHQDLDSDGDTCPDAAEAGTATQVGAGNAYPGTIVNVSGSSVVENAVVGAAGSYGINGFYNGIESNDTLGATYTGTYTYANAINAALSACFCYKPAITAGTVLDTNHGITSLQRAGTNNGNWPMVRKGAWTVLESKTKPFVPNRLTNAQVAAIPSTNLVKGMMVFNIDLDCLQININGTPAGWKCFDKQTCPTN
jgi:hypothetical protein